MIELNANGLWTITGWATWDELLEGLGYSFITKFSSYPYEFMIFEDVDQEIVEFRLKKDNQIDKLWKAIRELQECCNGKCNCNY